jgi:HlyD family secretion protein
MTDAMLKLSYVLAALGLVGLAAFLLRPSPVQVQIAAVSRGQLQVAVEDEGETRAHDRFVVAAPVTGRLLRVDLHDGDPVDAGVVIARIAPVPISVRECAERQARLSVAEAKQREANETLKHTQADYEQARRESNRLQELVKKQLVSVQVAEKAKNEAVTMKNQLDAARDNVVASASNAQLARIGLTSGGSCEDEAGEMLEVRSPVSGRVLRIVEKSERVVESGVPLMIVGDPKKLEVVVDVLSTEAVKVKSGMPVLLERWGGEQTLHGIVRTVEPNAFTKISPLGIEEQRVNIVVDFIDPPDGLGDGFRVDARIIVWQGDDIVKVPASAVFRYAEGTAVFIDVDGRARRQPVLVGHCGTMEMEILSGLSVGESVIVHPPRDLENNVRIMATH